MQLVLDNNGIVLKKRNNAFWVTHKKGNRIISPYQITSIAVVNDCLISSSAIKLAVKHQIPVMFYDMAGHSQGMLWSDKFGSIATIRRNQIRWYDTPLATQEIVHWIVMKTERQMRHLGECGVNINQFNQMFEKQRESLDKLTDQPIDKCRNQILGIEGSLSKLYWSSIGKVMPSPWNFPTRSRRPAQDAFNAALNYLYGMLYSVITRAAHSSGLDPYAGWLHVDTYSGRTFTYDLIEPFRPWIDELLTRMIYEKKINIAFFEKKNEGIYISKTGRKFLITQFNDYLAEAVNVDNILLSRNNSIYHFTGELAAKLKNWDKK